MNKTCLKVVISQPMKGKTEEEILEAKNSAIIKVTDYVVRRYGRGVEFLDTHFEIACGTPIHYLGKFILEGLAEADLLVCLPGWEDYDGCNCEHFIAKQYKVPVFYTKI